MSDSRVNELGLPIDFDVPGWQAREMPPGKVLEGRFCDVLPVDMDVHAADLHAANLLDKEHRIWVYLAYGPFETEADYREWMQATCLSKDPMFHAIVSKETGKAQGVASLMRINPAMGAIEVGHINYSPLLQRTKAATEAMYLLAKHVFDDLGYRRYEWKCNSLNERSCAAAKRLGFTYEGTFRQDMVYKGMNRDTAWYSMLDSEWPAVRAGFEAWLDDGNFAEDGQQRSGLGELIRAERQAD